MGTETVSMHAGQFDRMKKSLQKTLADVKHSHRCQALGRALGFKTYEAALAHFSGCDVADVSLSERAFVQYLYSKNVEEEDGALSLAEAFTMALDDANITGETTGCG